jgi:predicted Kef-type K+ transport protein
MFFFAVGATFNLHYLSIVILPAVLLAGVLLIIKPFAFRFLLQQVGEAKSVAWEVGVRLGQISEFSLIIAYVGMDYHLISDITANCIQAASILSFVVSSYWVVMRFPTPVAMSDRLRRD